MPDLHLSPQPCGCLTDQTGRLVARCEDHTGGDR